MQRLRLTAKVCVDGIDLWNRRSRLTLEPIRSDAWVWGNAGDMPITPAIFRPGWQGRWVKLVHGKEVAHEAEHWTFLYALGVRGIRVRYEGSRWPPFMCSLELWRKVRPLLEVDEELKPYRPTLEDIAVDSESGLVRSSAYSPSYPKEGLQLSSMVDYGSGKHGAASLWLGGRGNAPQPHLERALASKTQGRPAALKMLASLAEALPLWRLRPWPHGGKVLWLTQHSPASEYDELAWHKLNDGMVVSFASPPSSYLAGTVIFNRSGHALDLKLIEVLGEAKTVRLRAA